ncbi:cache domain-containing protein [Mesobacterium pallidum]|uniref:cache domain-containing protein n=1 Tax=Mesobacterium pallidum TaxID=2872037 RepID=UPI001EE1B655|nr:cache domain-containing protein [Mesobacterium pallidum]
MYHAPKLVISIIGMAFVFGLLGIVGLWMPIANHGRTVDTQLQADHALRSTQALQMAVSQSVEREWDSINAVAGAINPTDRQDVQSFADAVVKASRRVAWAGYVDRGGIVRVGSQRANEGDDVGSARWFREGLKGGYIDNVSTSVAARRGEDPQNGERVIKMVTPVVGRAGDVMGVFVYALRVDWLTDYVRRTANQLGLDAYILDRSGNVLLGGAMPDESLSLMTYLSLNTPSVRGVESRDGLQDIYAIVPRLVDAAQMPPVDLQLVTRVPAQLNVQLTRGMPFSLWLSLGCFLAIMVSAVAIFANHFIRPIQRLADIADDIAEGREVYPEEFHSSRESVTLSQALARIQNRMR